jgi:hypothetical protein
MGGVMVPTYPSRVACGDESDLPRRAYSRVDLYFNQRDENT